MKEVHRDAFSDEFDGVAVSKLVRRGERPAGGGPGDYAEVGSGWQLLAACVPRLELCPRPNIHADDPATSTLAAPDGDRA